MILLVFLSSLDRNNGLWIKMKNLNYIISKLWSWPGVGIVENLYRVPSSTREGAFFKIFVYNRLLLTEYQTVTAVDQTSSY